MWNRVILLVVWHVVCEFLHDEISKHMQEHYTTRSSGNPSKVGIARKLATPSF